MILDKIENAHRYEAIHPLFKKAFDYVRENKLTETAVGTYVLEEGVLKAIVSEAPGKSREASLEKFECHNRFIDIQYLISGEEQMGWKPRQDCSEERAPYSEEKDVLFFKEPPDTYFTLQPGQFVLFFPEDVHAPMIGSGTIKKLVIKIKV